MVIGWSPVPTRYRLTSPRGYIYGRCGADLLLNGLRGDVDAEAGCPVCANFIRFGVRVHRVVDLEPPEALLHVVEIPGPNISIECASSHIFDSEICQRSWLESYRGSPGSTYSLQGYLDHRLAMQTSPVHG